MAPFDFKFSNHFVASSDGTTLQVHELTANHMVHSFSIRKAHWKQVANINKEDDDHEDTEQISYDGLLFFDGHGRIEGTKALTVLAQHVNPEGYCFQESMELADYADFGIHYLRLNDLFSWPHHGVDLATTSVWSRSELKYQITREKTEELQKITREKNDEIARIEKDLEQGSKSSWAISPSVRYLPMGSEGERLHLTRRRQVPPETFVYTEQSYDFVSSNMPRIEACLNVFNTAKFVDEENTTGWPSPTSFNVLIGKNNRGFDKNNWWFAKANHPEGGLTMLAYYDGKFSQFTSGPDRTIPLPFLKDATLAPYKPFFLLNVHSFGVKLAFMYRV
ncbi:hypothetical protein LINGRAHAP2_LOCUS22752 [Linum grandiflorum]